MVRIRVGQSRPRPHNTGMSTHVLERRHEHGLRPWLTDAPGRQVAALLLLMGLRASPKRRGCKQSFVMCTVNSLPLVNSPRQRGNSTVSRMRPAQHASHTSPAR